MCESTRFNLLIFFLILITLLLIPYFASIFFFNPSPKEILFNGFSRKVGCFYFCVLFTTTLTLILLNHIIIWILITVTYSCKIAIRILLYIYFFIRRLLFEARSACAFRNASPERKSRNRRGYRLLSMSVYVYDMISFLQFISYIFITSPFSINTRGYCG